MKTTLLLGPRSAYSFGCSCSTGASSLTTASCLAVFSTVEAATFFSSVSFTTGATAFFSSVFFAAGAATVFSSVFSTVETTAFSVSVFFAVETAAFFVLVFAFAFVLLLVQKNQNKK